MMLNVSYQSISLLKILSRRISTGSTIHTRSIRPVRVIHSNVTNAVAQVMDAMDVLVFFEPYIIEGRWNHFPMEIMDDSRKEPGIFGSLVNCINLDGQLSRKENIDIVVIRENSEDGYIGSEHEVVPGVIQSFQVTMTKFWSDRIGDFAFGFAEFNNRKRVTAVHSKNMKLADAFLLESCQEVANKYEIFVENCCLRLVEKSERFDVIVTPNLYGNVIANIAVGVAGGVNGDMIMPGGIFVAEYAVFEQVVGSVGNEKNSVALLFSCVIDA